MSEDDLTCLEGLRILVVEDETLIAMTIEDTLVEVGAEVIATAATTSQALHMIEEIRPDAVTLDGNLNGELSGMVAKRLQELGIRYLVVTGYVELTLLDPFLAPSPRLTKPFTPASLQQAAALHLCP
jgi:CheY-like chemotaxis protein